MIKLFLILSFYIVLTLSDCDKNLVPFYTYRLSGNNLEWPCLSTKNIYTNTGRYISRNVIATRVATSGYSAIVATPRLKPGVPFTLGFISLKKGSCYSSIAPWPCWSMQEEGNCEALQNVVDLFLDPQGILWVLDIGIVNTLTQPIKRCPPKILAFDVKTGKVVKVIDLTCITTAHSRLQYLIVDYSKSGRAYVYIADAGARAILVYDITIDKGYRVVLPTTVTAGCFEYDVLYMVLVRKSCGTTVVYFTYLGSTRLYSIKTEHLRLGRGSGAVIDIGPKPKNKPIVLLGTDNGCSIFIRFKGESDIYLWNTETCFSFTNLLEVQRGGECRLATQVLPGYRNYMWTLESDFHNYVANNVGCCGASVIFHPVIKECDD